MRMGCTLIRSSGVTRAARQSGPIAVAKEVGTDALEGEAVVGGAGLEPATFSV